MRGGRETQGVYMGWFKDLLFPTEETLIRDAAQAMIDKRREDAGRKVDAVLKMNPDSTEGLYINGVLNIYKDTALAKRCFLKVTQKDPKNPWAWYMLAQIYSAEYRFGKALECCEKALAIEPLGDAKVLKMDMLHFLGRFDELAQYKMAEQKRNFADDEEMVGRTLMTSDGSIVGQVDRNTPMDIRVILHEDVSFTRPPQQGSYIEVRKKDLMSANDVIVVDIRALEMKRVRNPTTKEEVCGRTVMSVEGRIIGQLEDIAGGKLLVIPEEHQDIRKYDVDDKGRIILPETDLLDKCRDVVVVREPVLDPKRPWKIREKGWHFGSFVESEWHYKWLLKEEGEGNRT